MKTDKYLYNKNKRVVNETIALFKKIYYRNIIKVKIFFNQRYINNKLLFNILINFSCNMNSL